MGEHAEYQARLNQTSKLGTGYPGLQIEQRARTDRRVVVIIDTAGSGDPGARSAGAVPGQIPCAGVRVDRFRGPF